LVCRVLEALNECVTELIALQGLAKAATDKALFARLEEIEGLQQLSEKRAIELVRQLLVSAGIK
jgi:hypothetical protein